MCSTLHCTCTCMCVLIYIYCRYMKYPSIFHMLIIFRRFNFTGLTFMRWTCFCSSFFWCLTHALTSLRARVFTSASVGHSYMPTTEQRARERKGGRERGDTRRYMYMWARRVPLDHSAIPGLEGTRPGVLVAMFLVLYNSSNRNSSRQKSQNNFTVYVHVHVCTHFLLLGSRKESPGVEGALSSSLSSPLNSSSISSSSSSSSPLPFVDGGLLFFFLRLPGGSSPTRALKQSAGSKRNRWNCS